MGKIARISLSSSAGSSEKERFRRAISAMRNKGVTIVADWLWDGEDQSYLILGSSDKKQVAASKVIFALSRCLSGAGYK